MHPAEMEEIVLQLLSVRASRVQAYGCCLLLRGCRAEQSQLQECDHYDKLKRRDISSNLNWEIAYFSCNSLCPWLCSLKNYHGDHR